MQAVRRDVAENIRAGLIFMRERETERLPGNGG